MAYGNTGRILWVDLGSGKWEERELPEEVYREYIGGAGLAAKLLYDHGHLDAAPLDPENPLILAAGPLTGVGLSGSSRFSAGSRSPLTGIWGQSSCGGNFGPELKRCGYDAIFFQGRSEEPVYLLVEEGKASLLPASDLWGKDTYETTDLLKSRHGKKYKVLAIGPASENLVPFGSIVNDYGHVFGRTGMGTVMGAKNLKAVVARGEGRISFRDPEKFEELARAYTARVERSGMTKALRAFGTPSNMESKMIEGDVPTRNWGLGIWEEGGERLSGITLTEEILVRRRACRHCLVRCKPVVRVEEGPYAMGPGPGPEYETLGAFGTMLMNSNLRSVAKINDICNRLGMDTITCGATFAWAMDCYENGILRPEDYEGIELKWGDIDTVIDLLPRLVRREGKLAALLAKGSRAAAEEVGGGSDRFLTDTKGLEAPMHDPRLDWGDGLAYAVSVRGACHVSNMTYQLEWGAIRFPEIGLDRHHPGMTTETKAESVAKTTDLGCIMNSACWCEFPATDFTIPMLVGLFNAVAGYGWDVESMMRAGERVWFLQRCLGHIWGATGADDRLGQRIMTPVKEGNIAGVVPDMDTMLREFYAYRGLREDGLPEPEKLRALGLEYLAERLYG